MTALDEIAAALDTELQSAREVSLRARLPIATVEECLRELRRGGIAEFIHLDDDTFRWRLAPTTDSHGRVSEEHIEDHDRRIGSLQQRL